MKQAGMIVCLTICVFVLFSTCAWAVWQSDGILVASTWAVSGTKAVSDGENGIIIAWGDYRSGYEYDLYAQHVDASGNILWGGSGIPICTETNHQHNPDITSDGAGGAIITWEDWRSGIEVYAQRIDSSGSVRWTANGVRLAVAGGSKYSPRIVSDGVGGAIVTWSDNRAGDYNVYAQRVDGNGTLLWNTGGVPICTVTGNQQNCEMCSDGAGGAVVVWADARAGSFNDLYAQRVDPSGAVLWTPDGAAVCTGVGWQNHHAITTDGSGGAIVTWDDSYAALSVRAQRVNSSGALLWATTGVVICDCPGQYGFPNIAPDGLGGAIIAWEDGRGIYAQRTDSLGAVQWTTNGILIWGTSTTQGQTYVSSDGVGGIFIAWPERRIPGQEGDIYAQRVGPDGTALWAAGGIAVCAEEHGQDSPQIILDEAGGAIITWEDLRNDSRRPYAQRLDAYGEIVAVEEHNAPAILSSLEQNVPNPFNPTTHITFTVTQPGRIKLSIYDISGRLVRSLIDSWREPGMYREAWDGKSDDGAALSSGVYFYSIKTSDFVATRKMVLLR